jgi:hypothetical protein
VTYDLAEIPFDAQLKREFGLSTNAVLVYGALVAFDRLGIRPKRCEVARVAGLSMGDRRNFATVGRLLLRLEWAGLITRPEGCRGGTHHLMYAITHTTRFSRSCSDAA